MTVELLEHRHDPLGAWPRPGSLRAGPPLRRGDRGAGARSGHPACRVARRPAAHARSPGRPRGGPRPDRLPRPTAELGDDRPRPPAGPRLPPAVTDLRTSTSPAAKAPDHPPCRLGALPGRGPAHRSRTRWVLHRHPPAGADRIAARDPGCGRLRVQPPPRRRGPPLASTRLRRGRDGALEGPRSRTGRADRNGWGRHGRPRSLGSGDEGLEVVRPLDDLPDPAARLATLVAGLGTRIADAIPSGTPLLFGGGAFNGALLRVLH